jgi:hypothetical protein
MASNITAADHIGAVPVTAIECPDDGDDVVAAHIRVPIAALLANDDALTTLTTNLGNDKVNRAGDTMTDSLEITVSSSNQPALDATGNGSAPGVNAMGGATGAGGNFEAGGGNSPGTISTGAGTGAGVQGAGGASGAGGSFTAGGGNAFGLGSTGAGSGAGVVCVGGTTGPGILATPGTAHSSLAPQCAGQFDGFIEIIGDDPAQGVIPGPGHIFYGLSGCKAYCTVAVDGISGPYSKADAHNVSVVDDVATGIYEVTFQRAMLSAFYTVTWSCAALGVGVAIHTKTTGGFRFTTYDTSTKLAVLAVAVVDLQVFGRR